MRGFLQSVRRVLLFTITGTSGVRVRVRKENCWSFVKEIIYHLKIGPQSDKLKKSGCNRMAKLQNIIAYAKKRFKY